MIIIIPTMIGDREAVPVKAWCQAIVPSGICSRHPLSLQSTTYTTRHCEHNVQHTKHNATYCLLLPCWAWIATLCNVSLLLPLPGLSLKGGPEKTDMGAKSTAAGRWPYKTPPKPHQTQPSLLIYGTAHRREERVGRANWPQLLSRVQASSQSTSASLELVSLAWAPPSRKWLR